MAFIRLPSSGLNLYIIQTRRRCVSKLNRTKLTELKLLFSTYTHTDIKLLIKTNTLASDLKKLTVRCRSLSERHSAGTGCSGGGTRRKLSRRDDVLPCGCLSAAETRRRWQVRRGDRRRCWTCSCCSGSCGTVVVLSSDYWRWQLKHITQRLLLKRSRKQKKKVFNPFNNKSHHLEKENTDSQQAVNK